MSAKTGSIRGKHTSQAKLFLAGLAAVTREAPPRDWGQQAAKRTQLASTAPAPQTKAVIAVRGPELTARALDAWNARVAGEPIVDCAHRLGLSIEAAKLLIREAHDAIADDLKQNLDVNRQLDLDRLDGLIQTFYPAAKEGSTKAADAVLKCLQHRAKLTGAEPLPDPGRSNPQNVLNWIQVQLPSINRIVDALPPE